MFCGPLLHVPSHGRFQPLHRPARAFSNSLEAGFLPGEHVVPKVPVVPLRIPLMICQGPRALLVRPVSA
eukprot:324927-Alexandrium_andersonii.AAC.1